MLNPSINYFYISAVSRSLNPQYVEFMNVLYAAKRDYTNENKVIHT